MHSTAPSVIDFDDLIFMIDSSAQPNGRHGDVLPLTSNLVLCCDASVVVVVMYTVASVCLFSLNGETDTMLL